MEVLGIGSGTTEEFYSKELKGLSLGDKRLERRAFTIYRAQQSHYTTCVKRLFVEAKESRQAYDFF